MFGFGGKNKEQQKTLFPLPAVPPDDTEHLKPDGKKVHGRRRASKYDANVTEQAWNITHAIVNDQAVTSAPVDANKVDGSDVRRSYRRPIRRKEQEQGLSVRESSYKNSKLNALPPKIQGVSMAGLIRMVQEAKAALKKK